MSSQSIGEGTPAEYDSNNSDLLPTRSRLRAEYNTISDHNIPVMLHVSSDSRKECLSVFEKVPKTPSLWGKHVPEYGVYIDYECDIVLLPIGGARSSYDTEISRFTNFLPQREQSKIQRLVISMSFRKHLFSFPDRLRQWTHKDGVDSSTNIFLNIRQRLPNLRDLFFFCPGSHTHIHAPHRYPDIFTLENGAHECTYPTVKGNPTVLVDISHWNMPSWSSENDEVVEKEDEVTNMTYWRF